MSKSQIQTENKTENLLDKYKVPHISLILNLIVSHLVAIIVSIIIFREVFPVATPFALTFSLLAGTVVGLLFSLNLIFGLGQIEYALQRLSTGLSLKPISYRTWPLRKILDSINDLGGHGPQVSKLQGTLHQQLEATTAQEIRNRLARDLHDSIKQQIFSMNVSAAAIEARWENDPDGARLALADVRRGAKEAMAEMNALLQQLRPAPLEKVGLIEALKEQCEALGYRTGAKVTVQIGKLPLDEEWLPGTQEAIFRIAQEALANIARHARAKQVMLLLKPYHHADGKALMLLIGDDGRGFDLKQPSTGMGLSNIQERVNDIGGKLKILSHPDHGTTIRVEGILLKESPGKSNAEDLTLSIIDRGSGLVIIILLILFVVGLFLDQLPLFLGGSNSFLSILFAISSLYLMGFIFRWAFTLYRRDIQAAANLNKGRQLSDIATQRQKYLWAAFGLFLLLLFFPIHLIYLSGQVGASIPWHLPLISIPILGLPALYAWYKAMSYEINIVKQLSHEKKIDRIKKTRMNSLIILGPYILFSFANYFDFISVGDTMNFSVAAVLTLWPAVWIIIMTRYGLYLIWRWRIRFQNGQNQQTQEDVTYG